MPDAGQISRAVDWPAEVEAIDGTTITGISGTNWQPGSPEVVVSFVAPTSGRVRVTAWMHGDVNTGPYIILSFEASTDQAFTAPFKTGSFDDAARVSVSSQESAAGSRLVSGLSPGQTYWARTVHRTSSGSDDADIGRRSIHVRPAT